MREHAGSTLTHKDSFQYGQSVRLIAEVVDVCSPSTVMTANGEGRLKISRLTRPSAATMVMRMSLRPSQQPFWSAGGEI